MNKRRKLPDLEGEEYRSVGSDTWSSLALKNYGDAMLGGPLAEINGFEIGSKLNNNTLVLLPNPGVLNRRINDVEFKPDDNVFGGIRGRHILPQGGGMYEEENSVAKDARTRFIRAKTGMGLHAKGGGWKPIDANKPKTKGEKDTRPKAPRQPKAPPKLEDKWLRRMARISPGAAMKLARESAVGTGPCLALLGGIREADGGTERMELVERFLQAYASEGHITIDKLLKIVAEH